MAETAADITKYGKCGEAGANLSNRVTTPAGLLEVISASCRLRDSGWAASALSLVAGTLVDKNEASMETQAFPSA